MAMQDRHLMSPPALMRRLIKWALAFAVSVLLLMIVLVSLLQITSLRRAALDFALAKINSGETHIAIGELSGSWPRHLHLTGLTVADTQGIWLSVAETDIRWSPLALLAGEIHIRDFSAHDVDVARAPVSETPTKDTPGNPLTLPSLPFAIKLDSGHVENIILGRGLADPKASGTLARLDIETSLELMQERLDFALEIERQDEVPGHLKLTAQFDPSNRHLALDLDAADGDETHPGLAAAFSGTPLGPLVAKAQVLGLNGKIKGEAHVSEGSNLIINATGDGFWKRDLTLHLAANASGRLIRDALAPLGKTHELVLATDFRWDHRDMISLNNLALKAGLITLGGRLNIATVSRRAPHNLSGEGTVNGLDDLLKHPGNALLKNLSWRINSDFDTATNNARIASFEVTSDSANAEFKGDIALDGSTIKGDTEIALRDVAPLGEIIGQPMTGTATASLSPFAKEADGDMIGDFLIRTENIKTGSGEIDRLIGSINADGSLLLSGKGGFALPSFSVTPLSGAYSLKGNVAMTGPGVLTGEAHFAAPEIAKILANGEASGALKADVTLAGTTAAPDATLNAALRDGSISGVKTKELTLDLDAEHGKTMPLTLHFKGAPGTAHLNAAVTLPDKGGVEITKINGDIFGSDLTGHAGIDDASLVTAEIKSDRLALAQLGALAGVTLGGNGALTVNATPVNGKQTATLILKAPRIDAQTITLDRTVLEVHLDDLLGTPQVNAKFDAGTGQMNLTHLDHISARAKGTLDKLTLGIDMTGAHETANPKPFALSSRAIMHTAKANTLDLTAFKMTLGEAGMTLAKPVKLDFTNGFSAKALQLDMTGHTGAGTISGDVTIRSAAKMALKIEHAPLDLAALFMPADAVRGAADGTLTLDMAKGNGKIALSFHKLGIMQDPVSEPPLFDATVDGAWAKGHFNTTITAHGVSDVPFTLKASFPVVRPRGSAFPALGKHGRVDASLKWDGPLASLAALADLDGQRVAGDTHVALAASGDISAPVMSGTVSISNGSYENFTSGTALKSITARLEGRSSKTLSFTMNATDGAEGRVDATGTIALGETMEKAIDIKAKLTNAQLIHRSDANATIDGAIELTGPAFPPSLEEPATLSGALTARSLHITIPESLPIDVPLVEVTEINGPNPEAKTPIDVATPVPVMLDLTFKTNTPARISGRGLDSLWSGNLAITGRADQPHIKGTLNSERGTLNFAGKTFKLAKGQVNFPGTYPIAPNFSVTLTYTNDGFTATINVSGDSTRPNITFSSNPSLPKDEILSRILFDKGVGELTALEALQLTRTLAELSGVSIGGGGSGLMNRLQETLSLDVLRIDSSQSGATTVSAGKYIQKGIYVGVEQGALASDSAVKVEVEVTPQISLDTRVGQNATSDIGVNWKWDY
jgi:translocation and assembly module TamB